MIQVVQMNRRLVLFSFQDKRSWHVEEKEQASKMYNIQEYYGCNSHFVCRLKSVKCTFETFSYNFQRIVSFFLLAQIWRGKDSSLYLKARSQPYLFGQTDYKQGNVQKFGFLKNPRAKSSWYVVQK